MSSDTDIPIQPLSDPFWVYDTERQRAITKGSKEHCERIARKNDNYVILPNN